jgi:hypothetical protein
LVAKLTSTSAEDVLLPKLRELAWEGGVVEVYREECSVTEGIHRLFRARKKNKLPLELVSTFVIEIPGDGTRKLLKITRDSVADIGKPPLSIASHI